MENSNLISYQIYIEYDFHINERLLSFLYSPIIGFHTTILYKHLFNMASLSDQLGKIIHIDFQILTDTLGISEIQFHKSIKLLESMKLVETYKDLDKNDLVIFKLNEPLKWREFNKNYHYMNLLKQKLGDLNFEKIKFAFSQNNPLSGLTNVSATFEHSFNQTATVAINFDVIHDFLFNKFHQLISLDDNIKVILNNAFDKYDLTYQEIQNIILKSIIKENSRISIDQKILAMRIKEHLDLMNLHNFNQNLKINRNNRIFLQNANLDEFKYVIDDYKTLNSEQYLSCLQKTSLSDFEIRLIKSLRNNYKLPDFIINILLDFSIYKNNGRIEPLYLNKIAVTINRLSLNSASDILKHLQSANQKDKKSHVNYSMKVDW